MSDAPEVEIARLIERVSHLTGALERSEEDRRSDAVWKEGINAKLNTMDGQITSINISLAKNAPTIEEFITIKHKVVGAGQLGKWLWTVGGVLLGMAFASRRAIANWLSGI